MHRAHHRINIITHRMNVSHRIAIVLNRNIITQNKVAKSIIATHGLKKTHNVKIDILYPM